MFDSAIAAGRRGDTCVGEAHNSRSPFTLSRSDDSPRSAAIDRVRHAKVSYHIPGSEPADAESEPEMEPREVEPCAKKANQQREICPAAAGSVSSGQFARETRSLMRQIADAPKDYVSWLTLLRQLYGFRLLLILVAAQHVLKGMVNQLNVSSVMWLLRDYRVTGPRMQILASVGGSAWGLKPIIGLWSDLFPILGYHKVPYVVGASIIGIASTSMVGLSTHHSMSLLTTVSCLFGMSVQGATCDLLAEAKYSEHLHAKPAMGPDLISFVWEGITIGSMIAIATAGWLLTNLGTRSVFLACIVPSSAIILPALCNYFEEVPSSRERIAQIREGFLRQRELLFLAFLMTTMTFVLVLVGGAEGSHRLHFLAASLVLVILLPAFQIVLRPEIANVNTFFVLQGALSVSIGGASFYFYTDDKDQYPEGPHFSAWFFTTTLGMMASVMSLIGLASYTRYMKYWSYRSITLFSNCLVTVLSLFDVVMFLRWNRTKFGIPDEAFILGSSMGTIVVRQWQWIPGIVVMSHLCPRGMEATMFALLAGCANIGNQIADYLGAYLLELLDCRPSGAPNESAQFENLWIASCISTLLPAITIFLIPLLMPNARQTDNLLIEDPSSATAGSLLSRWADGRRARRSEGSS